jgi:hypothetical protein
MLKTISSIVHTENFGPSNFIERMPIAETKSGLNRFSIHLGTGPQWCS